MEQDHGSHSFQLWPLFLAPVAKEKVSHGHILTHFPRKAGEKRQWPGDAGGQGEGWVRGQMGKKWKATSASFPLVERMLQSASRLGCPSSHERGFHRSHH